jgi:hypothetical protein
LEGLVPRRTCDSTCNLAANYEAMPGIGNCMDNESSNGRWYSLRSAEYSRFTVSTCSVRTNFATEVSICYGDSCGALTCIDNPNPIACGWIGRVAEFLSDPFTTYYMLVHASEDLLTAEFESYVTPNDNLGGSQSFEFCLSTVFAPPLKIPGLPRLQKCQHLGLRISSKNSLR